MIPRTWSWNNIIYYEPIDWESCCWTHTNPLVIDKSNWWRRIWFISASPERTWAARDYRHRELMAFSTIARHRGDWDSNWKRTFRYHTYAANFTQAVASILFRQSTFPLFPFTSLLSFLLILSVPNRQSAPVCPPHVRQSRMPYWVWERLGFASVSGRNSAAERILVHSVVQNCRIWWGYSQLVRQYRSLLGKHRKRHVRNHRSDWRYSHQSKHWRGHAPV